jgi:alkaline phosphatase
MLSQGPQGFFLMIEGSQIDWGSHENDVNYAMNEATDLDNTVEVVLRFLKDEGLSSSTLVVVTADHETGGLSLNAHPLLPLGFEAKWTTKSHTGIPVPVFSTGPSSEQLSGFQDHAQIGRKLIQALVGKRITFADPPDGPLLEGALRGGGAEDRKD